MAGRVYLVGAGPGDPSLITVRGREILGRAEVLIYDALADDRFLLMAPATAERIYVGKRADDHGVGQAGINALLVEKARAGKLVVRLKGGDPIVFGRGAEECEALVEAGIPFEIVPGVTAGVAGPAYAGIPLTHRELASEVHFSTAHGASDKGEWRFDAERMAKVKGTLVLYMGVKTLGDTMRALVEAGRSKDTPAAVVQWATRASQRVVTGTIGDIAARVKEAGIQPPAITVVGDVVRLRETLAWVEKRPLFGKSVVVTRARAQAAELSERLEELGAEVIEAPTIEIAPPESWEPLDDAIRNLARYDWVALTSANAVEHFLARLSANGRDARALAGLRIAAVGSATAEALREAHLSPDAMPQEFNAEALSKVLAATGVRGKRFLFARAAEGREVLPDELRKLGAQVDVVPAYRTVRPDIDVTPLRRRLEAGRVDAITFASGSAVKNFAAHFAEGELAGLLSRTAIAVIGPVTARAVEELGLKVALKPPQATLPALVEALTGYLRNTAS